MTEEIKPKALFGLFSYFVQIDKDGSGYLELDEIQGNFFLVYSQYYQGGIVPGHILQSVLCRRVN
jgi:hypothetical protein